MSRGLIIEWTYHNDIDNSGVIAGCSPDVHGDNFGFVLNNVADPDLADFLREHPSLFIEPDCSMGPSAHWVSFTPSGEMATGIKSLFPETLEAVAEAVAGIPGAGFDLEAPATASARAINRLSDPSAPVTPTGPQIASVLTAHASALTAHAEAASSHARAASFHARAAEAHAREAARHSAALEAIGRRKDAPRAPEGSSKSGDDAIASAEAKVEKAPAKAGRKRRGAINRKRR
jgi:hypothetical protein